LYQMDDLVCRFYLVGDISANRNLCQGFVSIWIE
jgi:hypothetical protein